jgi:hypothetical protein
MFLDILHLKGPSWLLIFEPLAIFFAALRMQLPRIDPVSLIDKSKLVARSNANPS